MPTPTLTEFWQLAASSGLLVPSQITSLQGEFGKIRGAVASGNTRTLCEWLIDRRALSRFQCDVLLLGQPGPFRYGDYVVWDRVRNGRLRGLFRAIHAPTAQPVLLRFLTGQAAADPQRLAALAVTTLKWNEIDDPHLAACIEWLDLGNYRFQVVPELIGHSAAEQLRNQGRFPPEVACTAAQSIATALAALHRRGLVHGDVRPENVWLKSNAPDNGSDTHQAELDAYSGSLLLGFPLARDPLGPPAGLDEWTADYAAPEMAENGTPTRLTDIYALGCTLYELLTGQPPFAAGPLRQSITEKLHRHACEPIVPIDHSGPMPDGLNRVVSFMMAKNPAVRYPDMAAVLAALMPYAAAETGNSKGTEAVRTLKLLCRQRKDTVQGPGVRVQGSAVRSQESGASGQRPADQPVAVAGQVAAGPVGGLAPVPAFGFEGPQSFTTAPFVFSSFPGDAAPGAAPTITRPIAQSGSQRTWAIIGAAAAAVLLIVLFVIFTSRGSKRETPAAAQDTSAAQPSETASPAGNNKELAAPPTTNMPDDGHTLWASPTQGPPPQIRYVAEETQILAVLRPQAILSSPRGGETIDAMGPAGPEFIHWIETQTGVKPALIDRLDIAFYESFGDRPNISLVAYVKDRPAEAALVAAWKNPTPVDQGGNRFFQQGELCRYLPPNAKDVIVVAARPQMDQIVAAKGETAILGVNLQALVDTGDVTRHCTIYFLPTYLHSARDTLYPGTLAPLREAISGFLGSSDEVHAGAVSFELSDPLFAEVRLYTALGRKPVAVAKNCLTRVGEWSRRVQSQLISLTISAYSRDTLAQLPFMLQTVSQHTRHGAEGRVALLRCYLPGEAAANLALATDLLLLETAGTVGGAAPPPGSGKKTVWERLKQPVTLTIERDSLENALKQLSGEMGVKIEILGNDLKLDGITKNQPVALDMKNKPAEEVLGQIMLQANPDRTVKKLTDDVQKLVYVVKPAGAGGEDVILVTTRAKAAEHGELPAVFKK